MAQSLGLTFPTFFEKPPRFLVRERVRLSPLRFAPCDVFEKFSHPGYGNSASYYVCEAHWHTNENYYSCEIAFEVCCFNAAVVGGAY
jgi:hypothetical protein